MSSRVLYSQCKERPFCKEQMATVVDALISEDEIAHGEAFEPSRGGLGVCAYCDGDWPCRTQRGIDRLLAALAPQTTDDAVGVLDEAVE